MNCESLRTKHGYLINNYEVGLRTVFFWSSYTLTNFYIQTLWRTFYIKIFEKNLTFRILKTVY